MTLAVGVDVGGTKIAAGVVDARGEILRRGRRDTPSESAAAVEDAIADLVAELCTGQGSAGVVAVGIGAAGFVDASGERVVFAPNLAWRDEPLRDEVAARVGLPVVVENDANAAAWAEVRFGAAAGRSSAVAVTIGTGIGGGIVVGGRLYRGLFGMAAEFGHLRVVPEGVECGCGQLGCWEQYCSGRALLRRARALVATATPAVSALREACGDDPDALSGPMVTAAAQAGDPAAVALFAELGEWLGAGLAGLSAVLDPGCFVVGGGVAASGDLLLSPAREAYARRLPAGAYRPHAEILLAALGNDAGLIGAADLARESAS